MKIEDAIKTLEFYNFPAAKITEHEDAVAAAELAISALRAQQERENPLAFIDALRNSDLYIEIIYMDGGCYSFYLVLKALYPNAHPFMINMGGNVLGCNHIITLIDGKYYDIRGEFDASKYKLFEVDENAKEWSFCKNNSLYAECPNCEEPVFFSTPFNPLHDAKCVNPLTLEELKERVGKPVYIIRNIENNIGDWKVLIKFINDICLAAKRFIFTDDSITWADSYGKTWTAYDMEVKNAND